MTRRAASSRSRGIWLALGLTCIVSCVVADEWFYGPLVDERSGYTLLDATGKSFVADVNIASPSDVYALNHDLFAGFVVNEHIDHTAVSITPTAPLSGGGTIASTRTLTLSVDSTDLSVDGLGRLYVVNSGIDHDATTNFVAAEHIDWSATGAEDIHDDRIAESSVTQHEAAIDHDALTNFVANEHIDWTTDQGTTNIHTSNLNGLSGTVVMDDGTNYRVTMVFTNGLLTSLTVGVSTAANASNWTTVSVGGEASWTP